MKKPLSNTFNLTRKARNDILMKPMREETKSVEERENEHKEEFLHLLHQVVQHTPLKLSETDGSDYNKGYIFYQDMVLRDVEELETTMWEWHTQAINQAREEELEILLLQDLPESVVFMIKGRIKALNNQDKV